MTLVQGAKFDNDKVMMELLPPQPLFDIAEILTYGAKKYAPRNWEKGISYSRLFGATMRHMWSWWRGEDNDPETGKSHLAHAACCVVFLMQFTHNRREFDNRPGRAVE